MSTLTHHSIIVIASSEIMARQARRKAAQIFGHLAGRIIDSRMNSTYSFFIAPDGGSENEPTSRHNDLCRAEFIEYLNTFAHAGKNPFRYVEVSTNEGGVVPVLTRYN